MRSHQLKHPPTAKTLRRRTRIEKWVDERLPPKDGKPRMVYRASKFTKRPIGIKRRENRGRKRRVRVRRKTYQKQSGD